MATPRLLNPDDGSPTSKVPTVISCMSLHLLMHPWETRWGD